MLDSITYATDPSECLNINQVNNILEKCSEGYESFFNTTLKEPIEEEITSGGLDKYSLNIMGQTPANNMALSVMGKFEEVKTNIAKMKTTILEDAKSQRGAELRKLLQKVEEEIRIEKISLNKKNSILKSTQNSLSTALGADILTIQVNIDQLKSEVAVLDSKIKKLEEKQIMVTALLSDLGKFGV